jgi:hypothetical protein
MSTSGMPLRFCTGGYGGGAGHGATVGDGAIGGFMDGAMGTTVLLAATTAAPQWVQNLEPPTMLGSIV